ncbi:radical SAM protein [Opitutus sp. ER46]|uniref:radical SAM/SPASM domain-containing protein n=1 Tax=Opitutus sp. ER46 TaxID=2161864 RepID=UPI000D3192D3|nr:radical SAM protein [Opitutus sp. ER46]PTX98902.1 hypothetical protein DB354_02430 [Opitutus sp. ER46]
MLRTTTCLDQIQPEPDANLLALKGWFVADRPIRRLFAQLPDAKPIAVWLGDPRPDVRAAFPDAPTAARSGYLFALPAAAQPQHGTWWVEAQDGSWWQLPADWTQHSPVQREATAVAPEAVPADVRTCSDENLVEDRLRRAFTRGSGITLRLDLINKCNLRCIMCHYSQDEIFKRPAKSISLEQFRTLFEGIAPAVEVILLSCADEPLASKFFSEIVTYLRAVRPGLVICFCTNAMLMTAPLRKVIVEQGVDHVLFSIDGVAAATFEGIRKGANFQRVLSHITALRDLRRRAGVDRPILTANFVMMARNIHEAPHFIQIARELELAYVDFRHVVNCFGEFALQDEQLQHYPGRFNHYRAQAIAAGAAAGIVVYIPPALPTEATWSPGPDEPVADAATALAIIRGVPADAGELAPPKPKIPRVTEARLQDIFGHLYCTRPFTEITIRNQDEVLPCPWHRVALGRLSEVPDLKSHFFGPRFQQLRRAMLRPEGDENCRGCPLKGQELPSELDTA